MTKKDAFLIYGCPYTALAKLGAMNAFALAESDKNLFHFKRNTNRILNLIGFSGIKDIRLVGCSPEFTAELTSMIASRPESGICVTKEDKSYASFSLQIVGESSSKDVIIVERESNLIPVAFQLAREGHARIIIIDPVSTTEATTFANAQKDFESGCGLTRQNGLDGCCGLIKAKLGDAFFTETYSTITFITKLPYNLYPFSCPTAHLPARSAGELILAGLLKAQAGQLQTGVAVVLDSGQTQHSGESEYEVIRSVLRKHYGVLPAHRPADLGDFRHFVEDIPSDLVFLTAHCGQIELTEREATFCYRGKANRVRYAVNRCISGVPRSGLEDCETQYLPIQVNGIDWKDEACERELFVKFGKVEIDASLGMNSRNPEFDNIIINEVMNAGSHYLPAKSIGCSDDQYFVPLMHAIGCYYFPLVFNNACASYSGVCEEFVPDASFYIGTIRPVDSFLAVDVITKFVSNLGTMSVGQALFDAQRGCITNGYTPYLLAGVPWVSVPRCASRTVNIMNANSLLKNLMSQDLRDAHQTRLVFQEHQRKILLKQLFEGVVPHEPATATAGPRSQRPPQSKSNRRRCLRTHFDHPKRRRFGIAGHRPGQCPRPRRIQAGHLPAGSSRPTRSAPAAARTANAGEIVYEN
jgi:hypothetical protein